MQQRQLLYLGYNQCIHDPWAYLIHTFHQLLYGYDPLSLNSPETIMNNADYFKDNCSIEKHLSPSHTARTSVYPYTSPLGTFAPSYLPVPVCTQTGKSSLGYMDYPFSLRDICSNALNRNVFNLIFLHISDKSLSWWKEGTVPVLHQERVVGSE